MSAFTAGHLIFSGCETAEPSKGTDLVNQNISKHELKAQWEGMADDWISLMQGPEVSHREAMLDDWMLDAIGQVSGRKVIDLGCGEGRFSRMLAQRGAMVTGVDLCRPFIEFAVNNRVNDETYMIGDMEDLGRVPDEEFDIAVSYISLVDVPDMPKAVGEAYRVLRCGGTFVACNTHPMVSANPGWIKQGSRQLYYPVDRYFDEGERDISQKEDLPWTNFHRTLSKHFQTFAGVGFTVEDIREPTPDQKQAERYPFIADNLRVPEFIIFILRKPCQQ